MGTKKTLIKFLCFTFFIGAAGLIHGQEVESIWEGVYTEEQASRGEAVYNEACIACHGQDLGGNSNSPGLIGMGFMFLWEGRSLGELFETIRSAMPTDRPGLLPQQDYLDVVAFILQKNSFPAGTSELPSSTSVLNALPIEPKS